MNISPKITSLIDEIKNDRAHGASQLARQAVSALKTAAESSRADSVDQFLREQKEVGQQLVQARPAMAPIFNIVSRLLSAVSQNAARVDLAGIKQLTIAQADEIAKDSLQAIAQIAGYSSQLIADGDRIMTHSYSSTVVAGLKKAFDKCGNITVIATRSGPGHSGEITAGELGGYGIPVTFIDDAAMGLYIAQVSKVVIGADRICADGKVINGIGSYQLAIAAQKAGIPFYVLCETLKFDPRLKGDEVDLEEKEPSEIVEPGRLPPEVTVKNPYFDVTPLELVTGMITENGLLTPEEVISYLKEQPR